MRVCVRMCVRAHECMRARVHARLCERTVLQLARREDEMMRMNERMRQPGGFSLQADNLREANAQQTLMIKRLQSQVWVCLLRTHTPWYCMTLGTLLDRLGCRRRSLRACGTLPGCTIEYPDSIPGY